MATPKKPLKKPAKKPIAFVFKLFFVVAVVLIGGAAVRYMEEKHILDAIQARIYQKQQMQEALGWGSELQIEKKAEPLAKIRFMLRDKERHPIKGATVKLTLSHATESKTLITQNSITLPLNMVEPGVYRGQTELPQPGDWDAAITAQIGNDSYQVSERINLP